MDRYYRRRFRPHKRTYLEKGGYIETTDLTEQEWQEYKDGFDEEDDRKEY